MRLLLGGNVEDTQSAIKEVLTGCATGCTLLESCALEKLPDLVAQHRPDVAIVDFSGDVDVALRIVAEVREADYLRVLAVGPSNDAKLILRALNQGVDKYVDVDSLECDLPAALRHVRSAPQLIPKRGRVIAVIGAGGGAGATTLVANLGTHLSKKKECLLVDLDLEGGDLAAVLGVQTTNSIADFCEHLDRVDEAMLNKCLVACSAGMSLLPAPTDYRKVARVTPRGVRKALQMVCSLGSYIVVDVPSTFRPEQAQALFAADVIVLVVRAEFTSVRQASRILAYVRDLDLPIERIRLVVNRRQGRLGLRDADIESALTMRIHMSIPEHAKHMSLAVNRGIPLIIDRPRSPVSYRLMELAGSVNGVAEVPQTARPKG